jgi:hypothetical protein
MSALLKQVPLFVSVYYLTIICTYIQYGTMCPLTLTLSSNYGTVYGL